MRERELAVVAERFGVLLQILNLSQLLLAPRHAAEDLFALATRDEAAGVEEDSGLALLGLVTISEPDHYAVLLGIFLIASALAYLLFRRRDL